ncbi:MAG: septal ring lytic transglycosylase RlpA family protein [Akkermansiaceae bacterium]|nr:septal ring lytic transglycosylase RlpA family protein [Akkermansiaceae bacterium]
MRPSTPPSFTSLSIGIAFLLLLAGCNTNRPDDHSKIMIQGRPYRVVSTQEGEASWYSVKTNRGTHTASGQRLDNHSSTAAHRRLPFGTKVRVTNQLNGLSEILTINNRGPYIRGRIIDVTVGTAARLGFQARGVAPVRMEVLERVADAGS